METDLNRPSFLPNFLRKVLLIGAVQCKTTGGMSSLYKKESYWSISAFSSRRDDQEAVFEAEERLKDIRDATLAYKADALEVQRQLSHLQSQFDMLTGQASALIQGRDIHGLLQHLLWMDSFQP
ncbi:hypothetical protein SLEP1_g38599 [Rubroshorea leprosula]|uniref:HAUS augmin-like complex subunit 3 N-terminal domain-containing protein n=1 Tax=Rubroshorea leprosula TaxID=152421 RepID=A0AAV5KY78_9ROSI|nr:hypothetical protein SLEP1_g38599 [Rubroshorea leprosula]